MLRDMWFSSPSSGGSGVSDSLEVNLGIVGETSVDAPLPQLLHVSLVVSDMEAI